MINARDAQTLQTQLLKESNERFDLQEQNKQLMSRVNMLERDLAKKEFELTVASVASAITTNDDVHELIENNVALKEQVRTLKGMLDAMQSAPPSNLTGPDQQVATTSSAQDMADIQALLVKLNAKEEELSAIRVECRMWEEQFVELKFDLQSERDKQQKHLATLSSAAGVGNLKKDAVDAPSAINFGFPVTTSSKSTELQEYKNLAMQRAEYWKLSEMALDKANTEIGRLKQKQAHLEARLQDVLQGGCGGGCSLLSNSISSESKSPHVRHQTGAVDAAVQEARRETKKAQDTLTKAMKELVRLQHLVEDMPVQHTIETKRLKQRVRDLQMELASQKTTVDQLKSAALLYSPRNSRGIDVSRTKAHGSFKHISF
ncbi:hypothetical protein H310_00793 [Aphanomyces invadans]|uniref:Uncharacterized protein n=1 Tax=Aphanomyces invadans TaxID=157072 RepID=A0A024UXT8_9STRA|nr:hypothetical protein H310_00793 [Aphanomyces invadans]ETW10503.1 hypothetical protein H310_00793 [Aphanomyces invadans]|eukprot:XP_008861914.1 hypothetical protein H310_00793 [Aphanomyces invadans]